MSATRPRRARRRATPIAVLTSALRARSTVSVGVRRGYRRLLGGGLAIVLAGTTAAAAATWPQQPTSVTAANYLHQLESPAAEEVASEAATTGAVHVPPDGDLHVSELQARAELEKQSAIDLRQVRAAHRAAERRAAEQQAAAARAAQRQSLEAAASNNRSSSQSEATAQSTSPPPAATTSAGGERGTLAGMVNSLRGSNGLSGLNRDATLDGVAQRWAEWMASNRTLQHNPNLRGEVGGGWSRTGENIVRNTGAQSWSSSKITSWMFNWWSNSAPHRANMLNTAYTHIGVGYAMGSGGPYAVLVFGGR